MVIVTKLANMNICGEFYKELLLSLINKPYRRRLAKVEKVSFTKNFYCHSLISLIGDGVKVEKVSKTG